MNDYVEIHQINHEGYKYPVLHINSNTDTVYEPENYESLTVGNQWLKTIKEFIYTFPNR